MDDQKATNLCAAISAYVNGADATLATRKSSVAFGEAVYLAHVCFGLSLHRIALQFGAHRDTIAQQARLTEERRDNAVYDDKIIALEGVIASLKAA